MRVAIKTVSMLSVMVFAVLAICACQTNNENNIDGEGEFDPENQDDDYYMATGHGGEYPMVDGDYPEHNGYNTPENAGIHYMDSDMYEVAGDLIYSVNRFGGFSISRMDSATGFQKLGSLFVSGYPISLYVVDSQVVLFSSHMYEQQNGMPIFNSQVSIIDVSDIEQPVLQKTIPMTGTIADTAHSGNQVYAISSTQDWQSGCDYLDYEAPPNRVTAIAVIDLSDKRNPNVFSRLQYEGIAKIAVLTEELLVIVNETEPPPIGSEEPGDTITVIDLTSEDGDPIVLGHFGVGGYVFDRSAIQVKGQNLFAVTSTRSDGVGNAAFSSFDLLHEDGPTMLMKIDFPGDYSNRLTAALFTDTHAYFSHGDTLHNIDIQNPAELFTAGSLKLSGIEKLYSIGSDLLTLSSNDHETFVVSLIDTSSPNRLITRDRKTMENMSLGWRQEWQVDRRMIGLFPQSELQGLLVVPVNGYIPRESGSRHVERLYLLDYSNPTIAIRGFIETGSPVQRSFLFDGRLIALTEVTIKMMEIEEKQSPKNLFNIERSSKIVDIDSCDEDLCTLHISNPLNLAYQLRRYSTATFQDAPIQSSQWIRKDYVGRDVRFENFDGRQFVVSNKIGSSQYALNLQEFNYKENNEVSWLNEAQVALGDHVSATIEPLPGYLLVSKQWPSEVDVYDFNNPSQLELIGTIEKTDWLKTGNVVAAGADQNFWVTQCEPMPVTEEDPTCDEPDNWPRNKCYAQQVDINSEKQTISTGKRVAIPGQIEATSGDLLYAINRTYSENRYKFPSSHSEYIIGCNFTVELLQLDDESLKRVASVNLYEDPNGLFIKEGPCSGANAPPHDVHDYDFDLEALAVEGDSIMAAVSVRPHDVYTQCGIEDKADAFEILSIDRTSGEVKHRLRMEGYQAAKGVKGGGLMVMRKECYHGGQHFSFVYVSPEGEEYPYPEKRFLPSRYATYQLPDLVVAQRIQNTVYFAFESSGLMHIDL